MAAPQQLSSKQYEKELLRLQTELVYMQEWIVAKRHRAVAAERRITLIKYWLSVSDEEQERRFEKRLTDPRKRWKFSPTDLQARARWVDYAEAKDRMFTRTDTDHSPWHVEADDKRTARLNLISHLLSLIPYEPPDKAKKVKLPARQRRKYKRPPKQSEREVPVRYTVS